MQAEAFDVGPIPWYPEGIHDTTCSIDLCQVSSQQQLLSANQACDSILRPFSSRFKRTRAILTAQEACEIFLLRPMDQTVSGRSSMPPGDSSAVSQRYGMSPKAIRDIWNRYRKGKRLAPACISDALIKHPQQLNYRPLQD
jgi:hypothetical protein